MFIEPEQDGDPFEVSDADTMLRHLDPQGEAPNDVILFGKPGRSHCARAKRMLEARGRAYEEIPATPRRLRAVSGKGTAPRAFPPRGSRGVDPCRTEAAWRGASQARKSDETALPVR